MKRYRDLPGPPPDEVNRSHFALFALALSVFIGGLALISGPGSFDFIDGTEFVICGRSLQLPHPPGYPLYIFFLRVFALAAPCARLDYSCFRLFSALTAGAGAGAACFALRSFRVSRAGALAGSVLLFTTGPVLAQINVVEVHGFAILLALLAIGLRNTPSGPYMFSMSLFAGHPVSFFLFPSVLSARFRERWLLAAFIPLSLWLFIPLRSAFPGLCHYSAPATAFSVWRYLTLYGSRLTLPAARGLEALVRDTGAIPLMVMAGLALYSRRWSWKLFLSLAGSLLFVSSYSIPDTGSILWTVIIPLGIWASLGLARMLGGGRWRRAAAAALLAVSISAGVSLAWRRGDTSAKVIAEDYLRGAAPGSAFVTAGMSTFHTAYLLEVDDRRPDLLPLDIHRCFFRVPPPDPLPARINGRTVFAVRGWYEPELELSGLLFSPGRRRVDWNIFEAFRYSGGVHEPFARDEMAELWARRGIQTDDADEREACLRKAMEWAAGEMTRNRIRTIFEIY
ncbi:MAG: DUF2723 domain-containing protein [Candidatus Aegiribacteria sp.]